MNQYRIEHKVRTLAKLYADDAFEYRGYSFEQWSFTDTLVPSGRAWHASKTIDAADIDSAFIEFRRGLSHAVDRIAFVSQCSATHETEPYLIIRLDENPRADFFCYYSREAGPVSLNFRAKEVAALEALESYEARGEAFRLLREAGNATSFYTRFSMLAAALEALAGEITDESGRTRTNGDYIRDEILQDADLKQRIFQMRKGLRNQIFHGRPIDGERHDGIDYVDQIYQAILSYFREKHGVVLNTKVVNPMRTLTENFRGWAGWLRPHDPAAEIELRRICELIKGDDEQTELGRQFTEKFAIRKRPDSY